MSGLHIQNMKGRHQRLWQACTKLPQDYEPWGQEKDRQSDCSCGCRWYVPLFDPPEPRFRGEEWAGEDADWGVCCNLKSHRVGLLTFEHQGCHAFEYSKGDR